MPNVIKILRSSATTVRPAGKTIGEPYVNFADMQFGVHDATAPIDLLAITFFSATATYPPGSIVVEGGKIFHNPAGSPPGAWNPANWTEVGGTGVYLPLTGGALSGPLDMTTNAIDNALLDAGAY